MSFINSNFYAGDKDQRLVQTPYGKGLVTKIRQQKEPTSTVPPVKEIRLLEWENAKAAKSIRNRSTVLYSTTDFESIPAKKGDDVITPYGRGTITESVTVRILNKGKVDPVTKEPIGEKVLTKFHIQINSWRIAGRSRVKCYLFSNQVEVVRKKTVMEMDAMERVEFAMNQKKGASAIFAQKKYREALNAYSGCIDAVRFIQHDTNSDNYCRADLIEVMVTCSNNAATCCIKLKMWEEAFKFAKNALILLNALFGKRGANIHTILNEDNGHCDAKLFGEWRVKSRLIMGRSLFEKQGYDLALEELRQAREHITFYVMGDGLSREGDKDFTAASASVLKLRYMEKEINELRSQINMKKKLLLMMEKRRAQAMFRDSKPKDEVEALTPTKPAEKKTVQIDTPKEKVVSPSTSTNGKKDREPIRKKVSFAERLEETREIVEEEEEEDPWYEEHKEALILVALGGLAFASVIFARKRH